MGGHFFMAKYSFEFKKQIIQDYLNGKGGAEYLANMYGIPAPSNVKRWIKAYKKFGDKGLMRSQKKETYTFEFKLHVVELYLSTEVSYQELSLSVGISNYAMIVKWVNDFRIVGPDALRPKPKGRKKSLKSSKTPTSTEQVNTKSIDTSAQHIKQLEDENLKLRIENAYLKELRRLRLEEETLLKKQRESSTTSEETSN